MAVEDIHRSNNGYHTAVLSLIVHVYKPTETGEIDLCRIFTWI